MPTSVLIAGHLLWPMWGAGGHELQSSPPGAASPTRGSGSHAATRPGLPAGVVLVRRRAGRRRLVAGGRLAGGRAGLVGAGRRALVGDGGVVGDRSGRLRRRRRRSGGLALLLRRCVAGDQRLGGLAGQRVVLLLDGLLDLLLRAGHARVPQDRVLDQFGLGLLEALGLALAGLGQRAPLLGGALARGAGVLGRRAADVGGLGGRGVDLGLLVEAGRMDLGLGRRDRRSRVGHGTGRVVVRRGGRRRAGALGPRRQQARHAIALEVGDGGGGDGGAAEQQDLHADGHDVCSYGTSRSTGPYPSRHLGNSETPLRGPRRSVCRRPVRPPAAPSGGRRGGGGGGGGGDRRG